MLLTVPTPRYTSGPTTKGPCQPDHSPVGESPLPFPVSVPLQLATSSLLTPARASGGGAGYRAGTLPPFRSGTGASPRKSYSPVLRVVLTYSLPHILVMGRE